MLVLEHVPTEPSKKLNDPSGDSLSDVFADHPTEFVEWDDEVVGLEHWALSLNQSSREMPTLGAIHGSGFAPKALGSVYAQPHARDGSSRPASTAFRESGCSATQKQSA